MENPIAIYDGHKPLLPKLGQETSKIVSPGVYRLLKLQFHLQGMAVLHRIQPIH